MNRKLKIMLQENVEPAWVEGDVNLTFKRCIESPIRLRVEDDYVTRIEGECLEADLIRSYIAPWGDSMALYDKCDFNGTELRAFAGNFPYSTGANEVAGRYTRGHFDLPLRHCTVELDGAVVIDGGRVAA